MYDPNPIYKRKSTPGSEKMIFPHEHTQPFLHQKHQYYNTSQMKLAEIFQHWNQQTTSSKVHSIL